MAEIEEEGILVAVRIRPLFKKELSSGIQSCCQTLGDKNIAIRKGGDANGYLKSQQSILNEYAFDAVFDDKVTQEDVYMSTAKKYIPNFVNGKNVTVFAYGATGAGKTHTMLGNSRVDSSAKDAGPGIIPCAVRDIFEQISHREQTQADENIDETFAVSLGYIEVYNEQVYDLLGGSGKVLAVREDQERGIVVVAGMQEQLVKNYDEVTEYMMQGNRNRKTEATMANAVSSRSHAVLQLTLRRTILRLDTNKETVIESKLSLIDLAGSERASATNNRGARLQEGANINKSLLALANCINALSENAGSEKKSNVKFRDSKLTHLLKSSLEGNCNLIMIANINPSDTTYEDSNNTLKYANRAKNIKVNPTVQETAKDTTWLERELRLRGENAALRAKVADLTKLLNEAQEFRNEIISLCARGTFVEEVQQYAEGKESFGEFLASDRSIAAVESDTSFSGGDTSNDDSTPSRSSLADSPEPVFPQAPAEMNLRSKRRASMSAMPAKAAPARSSNQTSVSGKVSLPSVALAASKSPQETLFDSEDDAVPATLSGISANTRKRRASCLPTASTATAAVTASSVQAPAPVPPARQSARRSSMTPKMLSSTIAATKAAVDAAAAAAVASSSAKPKTSNALAGRVTRRKSLMLSATAPIAAAASSESATESSDTECAAVPADSTIPDASPARESEPMAMDSTVKVLPTIDESAEEPVTLAAKRRTQIRRGSLGGASAVTSASDSAEPLRSSNRRRSIAEVTAMLASIDAVKSLLPTATSAVPAESKKRAVEDHDENARRKNARIDLSDIPELQDTAPAHVWVDI